MELVIHEQLAACEDTHWWCRARREILESVIAQFAPAPRQGGLRLVEVGCGSGGNLPMLAKFGAVVGAEPEPIAVSHFRQKRSGIFEVIHHRVPEPLPGRYHVIGMFDVLEHIDDDVGALKWAAEQLEPGGILVLSVPAFQFLWSEQDEAAHHFRRYTPDQILRLVPPSLSVAHLTCFNTLLFPAILAARTVMRMKRRTAGPPRWNLALPPEPFNWLLYQILRLERFFVSRRRFRFGVSILLVARRHADSPQTSSP